MSHSVEKNEKYALIAVSSEKLDTNIAPDLKSEFLVISTEGHKNIILDLSDVKYCDSSGLSAILVANRLCKELSGCLVIASLQDSVKKLITISQLDSVLNITPTLNEAIDYLFMVELQNGLEGDS